MKVFRLIKKYRQIPERKKIIVYGKLAFLKNLFYFVFKIVVGIVFKSWFLIAIALYGLCIGYVKNNCSSGLWRNKDSVKDIFSYIQGGAVLSISSICYIVYSIFQIYFPSNTKYNLIIAIAIACFAFYSISMSMWGVIRAKGKTMLIKQYKLTNFATAFNNLVLTQIAILSVIPHSGNTALYNGIIGIVAGCLVLITGIYLIIDGVIKKHRYERIIKKYPEIDKYLNKN
ncbi:MAG: hypothetical protein IKM43_03235 [Clostridia bacterium]|nr:hypothetical protein [Clostridia bacterium]